MGVNEHEWSGSTLKAASSRINYLQNLTRSASLVTLRPSHALVSSFSYLLLVLFAARLKSRSKIRCLLEHGQVRG